MIKGKVKDELTIQNILSKISEYDIYRMFMPHKFTVGRVCKSPFRKDDHPSFLISNKVGNYVHVDFADGTKRGRCFAFVMQLEGVDFYNALKLIDKRFGLGLAGTEVKYKEIVSKYEQPVVENCEVHMEATHMKFDKRGHEFWNAYHLTEDYLKGFDTFQVRNLYIARKRFPLPKDEPVFVYRTKDGKIKVYRPFVPRKVSKEESGYKWRFRTNISSDYIFGIENMKKCKKGLVLKSRKDELVVSLIFPCVSSVQSETIACFSDENVKILNEGCEEVYVGFGSDEQGKRESNLVTQTFGWKHINTPDKYLPHNDFAEVGKIYGLEVLEKHFKNKGLL